MTAEYKIEYFTKIETMVKEAKDKINEIYQIISEIDKMVYEGLEQSHKELAEVESYFLNEYDILKRKYEDSNIPDDLFV